MPIFSHVESALCLMPCTRSFDMMHSSWSSLDSLEVVRLVWLVSMRERCLKLTHGRADSVSGLEAGLSLPKS